MLAQLHFSLTIFLNQNVQITTRISQTFLYLISILCTDFKKNFQPDVHLKWAFVACLLLKDINYLQV